MLKRTNGDEPLQIFREPAGLQVHPGTGSLYGVPLRRDGVESNDTILDIGSGLGTNRRLFPKARYTGVDRLEVSEAKRLTGLQSENAKLKKLLAECHAR
jgi:hypothetical protein